MHGDQGLGVASECSRIESCSLAVTTVKASLEDAVSGSRKKASAFSVLDSEADRRAKVSEVRSEVRIVKVGSH